jgi:hypothetical protein
MVGVGSLLTLLWLRLLVKISGIRKAWRSGSSSVFDLHARIMHSKRHLPACPFLAPPAAHRLPLCRCLPTLPAFLPADIFSFSDASLEVYGGTPFMRWAWRLVGIRVGHGAVLMGSSPMEVDLLEVGTALHCTALHCTALHCTALHWA